MDPKRILLINVARIGDTVLAVPLLRALRAAWPQAELSCLAHPKRAEVLAGLPWLNHLGSITKTTAFWRGRFGKTYDLALVLGREPALIAYALRAATKVIAQPVGVPALDAHLWAQVADEGVLHAVDDRLRWLKPLGIPAVSKRLEFTPSADEQAWAQRWVTEQAPARPRIGLQMASFPTKAYRNWPREHFAELVRRIRAAAPHAEFLVFGDSADRPAGDGLAAATGATVHNLAGQLSLRQSIVLMAQLDGYIGVDTGPTHLAGALGIPMVALYHALHPGRYLAPLEHPSHLGVIEHPAMGPAASTERTMAEITVDAVWAEVQTMLQAGGWT